MISITAGITVFGSESLEYVGVSAGRLEYRIYTDREGWYMDGCYVPEQPKGKSATGIKKALDAGGSAFQEFLDGKIQKWELKERAGI